MKQPAHAVVDKLGLGECLVATLVRYDPKTSGEETGPEAVQGPEREPCYRVKNGMRQTDGLWSNESVKECRSFINTTNDNRVMHAVTEFARQRGGRERKRQMRYM